jgi:AcrR family transcriptional regulator
VSGRWLEAERETVVVEHVLDRAAQLFAEQGVNAVSMAEVAQAAGCSRATLYRYFANRRELQQAFVDREARRIATQIEARTGRSKTPTKRLVDGIVGAIAAVRAEPTLRVWFTDRGAGTAADLAHDSPAIGALARAFVGGDDTPDTRTRADWVVRVIVSFLTTPGQSTAHERRQIERFVAPVVVAKSPDRAGA